MNIIGVWVANAKPKKFAYTGQITEYLQLNKEKFENAIFIGDFNTNINICWEKADKERFLIWKG
ncbi:MAG: hypothetical protein LBD29_03860, partial [Treponema sp.]|nr:hypothetical protein [Treponema sp.]